MLSGKSLVISNFLQARSGSISTQMFWVFGFSVLAAIGAQIEVPHQPVPFTLQTFFVLLAGAVLGARNGAVSMGAYLMAGIAGIPVFSGAGFGIARILGPTGGYLLAFPLAAAVVGLLLEKNTTLVRTVAAMALGLLVIFSLGTLQLKVVTGMSWTSALVSGFLIFSWWDILKLAAASGIYQAWSRIARRMS